MKMKLKKNLKSTTVIAYIVVSIFALFCLFPFIMVVSGSLTPEEDIVKYGYSLIPRRISFDAYRILLYDIDRILNAYKITIFVTVVGTLCSLLVNSMAGYVLSRKVRYQKPLLIFTIITMLFSGGMVPWYIVCVRYLHLKDTVWALILPTVARAWYIFLLRNFFKGIPEEMYESSKIDGASELTTFVKIMLPLAKPAIATVTLFASLAYWNDWWAGLMLIDDSNKQPLQLLLRTIVSNTQFLQSSPNAGMMQEVSNILPVESVKMAIVILTIGPIIFVYPFIQKYFVKGIMVGAVKG
jgi:putative aldouronate transport system permease protein